MSRSQLQSKLEDAALTTEAYLLAIKATRPTVTEAVVNDFLEEIERIARV